MVSTAGPDELIRLEDVTKTYRLGDHDVPVLRGVSLTIGRGEFVALMGPSGSGKSTLMNLLGCLDRASSGHYWLDGEEVSRASADRRAVIRGMKLGFVFQNFNLLSRTTALENVLMPLEYAARRVSERQSRTRAVELLTRVGLADRLGHEPARMSGGQQQRVAIARALVNDPPVLLADEPTGNLDSRTSREVLDLFREINAERGLTIILVTHDASVAAHADRAIRVHDGLVVDGAFTEQVATPPRAGASS
jgi:ABC-type lipoprotein export system ATPase subunit